MTGKYADGVLVYEVTFRVNRKPPMDKPVSSRSEYGASRKHTGQRQTQTPTSARPIINTSQKIGAEMSKNANKRTRRKAEAVKPMTAFEVEAFKTGYDEPELVKAANRIGICKGSQKVKRDKIKHATRYYASGKVVSGRADKASGCFMNPNSSNSYIQPGAYSREVNQILATGNTIKAFKNTSL